MNRLHEIEVFIAVAEAGSFARAATRLRLSPPAVTRAVAALEDRLGARVFNRTTRSVTITDVGRRFLESARRVVSDLESAEREALGEAATPQGHLTVTASVTFGRAALAPLVCEFLALYPRVTVSVLLLDRVVNLVEEGVDVAARIGPLPDSGLMARKVGTVHRILVASPAYLVARGVPMTPADLRDHAVVGFTGLMPNREWRYVNGSKVGSVALHPRFEINDAATAIEAAVLGHGITIALSYMVADLIHAGRLVPVLQAYTLPPQPVHLVYPETRLVAPKIRAFLDFAAPRLKASLHDLTLRDAGA
ncbi:MAG: LysR family transcriptional regulator [Roseovarius sp. BRH_c41]|jgi:DNA-binding transcriptional LysR family regulator|uniref:LysR substrate-binding domain-containing protein n=1 Tax=Roseovarius sp. BRH_c41 TaxID=1629709 RepID=UPI0005F154E1|nr:LysR substrate-binding domain-containing protein [Roseovarius sp. BRH_c41]KJS42049.1 MAG: LysR family transcriptional regulator [Roseovarius sp. BRH_c41]